MTDKENTTENITGLTAEEVARLASEGHSNKTNEKSGKSYLEIVLTNLLTFFNMIWAIVAALLIIFRSPGDLTFLFVVVPNILIATVLEIRAKRAVEKLAVTTAPHTSVLRDGELLTINSEDVVLGDIIRVEVGQQIPADAVVISGVAEANESLLTGESDAIKKEAGDRLLAGSFVVSGAVYAKVTAVGRDNYVYKLEKAARNFKAPASNLFKELNRLIKYIGIFMVPMAVALFFSNLHSYDGDTAEAVIKTCGSIIGMIPAGIYLLVTVTLTLSVITLSRRNTLVQDMYSIEMLASADVVCLDKTGTITDGTMCVRSFEALADMSEDELRAVMAAVEGAEDSINNTSRALIEYFGKSTDKKINEKIPFSSKRKYSAVDIEGLGAYSIGAPHFVKCEISDSLEEKIAAHAALGERVLVLARHESLASDGYAVAMIAISDRIRPNAKETIEKFQRDDVTVKIISGDHAATVATMAKRVGVKDADKYVSCENLTPEELEAVAEEYAVFGRVTPEQKVILVKKLRSLGHTVAMTGDGVNDTLALKESNCAIAMADGSEVARKISQIVLGDSDFSALPDIVREGRRCINNVRQSASLFLMKTIFTIVLSIIACVTLKGYPFQPRELLMLELLVIGIPSVLLALEPNNNRIQGSFLKTVIIKSIPSALALITPVAVLMAFGAFGIITQSERNAIGMLVITTVGWTNLLFICRPYSKWRLSVALISAVGIALALFVTTALMGDYLGVMNALTNVPVLVGAIGLGVGVAAVIHFTTDLIKYIRKRRSA
ncbi:MAG: HAD-IC family P-type ATPase [Clostridia bacterium]|nr:HAD-IC family P-type ATPase [Clostridia bacterium]